MLFLIRKKGLQRHDNIIEHTTQILTENNYFIHEEGLITIKENKKTFLNKLYHDKMVNTDIEDAILNANDNQCYFFITDYNAFSLNSTEIKHLLRKLYPNPENRNWNYFHSSDNISDAFEEINILKSNKNSLNSIGTYYKQVKV